MTDDHGATGSDTRQIVAMAGGGFSMEQENPLLDRYILGLCQAPRPKSVLPSAGRFTELL